MRLLTVCFATLIVVFQNTAVLVQTRGGKVRGVKQTGSEGDEFCAFKGIPYANPPIGELRFRDPEPADPWPGVLDATANAPQCAQYDFLISKLLGLEDCLYLNVYAKSTQPRVKRPVMVWIHGGAFVAGSGDDSVYGPDDFMRKDVVLVAMNYRLGIFGFLNLDDESASGNQGLKDMVMALEWVRDNIANFGGDPDNVTIFGESTSSRYLRLFHKVISQSGVAINPWAFFASTKEHALRLSDSLGYKEQDIKSVIQFLRTASARKINKAQKTLLTKEEIIQGALAFGPSIDSKSKNPFLPVHPRIAAAVGIQVPLLIGHNTRGLVAYKYIAPYYDRFNDEFGKLLHPDLASIIQEYGLTMENLKLMYFKNDVITKESLGKLVDLYGDVYFVEGIHKVLKTQVEKSSAPTYFYQFSYDKQSSVMKVMFNTQMNGSAHGDEVFYLFRVNSLAGMLKFAGRASERYRISVQMVEMWVNFATTGTPTPKPSELIPFEWQPIGNDTVFPFMNICENLRMDAVPKWEQKLKAH